MSATPLPDPLSFTSDALARGGAIIEPGDTSVIALLPPELGKRLGVPEEVALSTSGAPGTVSCALGTELLERLINDARSEVPVTAAALKLPAPKTSHAHGLADRYVVRNGVATTGEVHSSELLYAAVWLSFVAEADERHEGVTRLVFHSRDGSRPDATFVQLCDPLSPDLLGPTAHAHPVEIAPWVERYGRTDLGASVEPIRSSTERRHARDYDRIVEYYAALISEARAPRRKVDPAAIEAKVSHLVADRDAKLRDLATRFQLRVSTRVAGLLWLLAPAASATLHVKRRKATRDIMLHLPAGAGEFDALPCSGCAGATSHPAFCDDAMHTLCEVCVPTVTGRPDCPACKAST